MSLPKAFNVQRKDASRQTHMASKRTSSTAKSMLSATSWLVGPSLNDAKRYLFSTKPGSHSNLKRKVQQGRCLHSTRHRGLFNK